MINKNLLKLTSGLLSPAELERGELALRISKLYSHARIRFFATLLVLALLSWALAWYNLIWFAQPLAFSQENTLAGSIVLIIANLGLIALWTYWVYRWHHNASREYQSHPSLFSLCEGKLIEVLVYRKHHAIVRGEFTSPQGEQKQLFEEVDLRLWPNSRDLSKLLPLSFQLIVSREEEDIYTFVGIDSKGVRLLEHAERKYQLASQIRFLPLTLTAILALPVYLLFQYAFAWVEHTRSLHGGVRAILMNLLIGLAILFYYTFAHIEDWIASSKAKKRVQAKKRKNDWLVMIIAGLLPALLITNAVIIGQILVFILNAFFSFRLTLNDTAGFGMVPGFILMWFEIAWFFELQKRWKARRFKH